MDVQRSLSDIYNMCDLAHDTRSHLGAQEALQRAYRVCSARLCKERHKGVHLGLDPVYDKPPNGRAPRFKTFTTCIKLEILLLEQYRHMVSHTHHSKTSVGPQN